MKKREKYFSKQKDMKITRIKVRAYLFKGIQFQKFSNNNADHTWVL